MRYKLSVIFLSLIMIFSCSMVYAEDGDLIVPEQPTIEDKTNNESIKQYNAQVEDYNHKVDEYNAAATQKNEENKAKSEAAKVNNEATKKAEAEANAAEDKRVAEENAVIEEKYQADLTQYEKDKEMEDKILAVKDADGNQRYQSVEDYNNTVDTYNEKVTKRNNQIDAINQSYGITDEEVNNSPTRNTTATQLSADNTYEIIEGETKSGRKIPVHIQHNFTGTTTSYSTDFEIDANDTIILKGIAAVGDALNETSCLFFYNTDENHTLGVWSNSWSILYTNPTATNKQGWTNGDTHTVTYKDSTNEYQWNFEDISIEYNYLWTPLYKKSTLYDHANIPVLPVANYVTPNYVKYDLEDESYTEISLLSKLSTLPLIKQIVKKQTTEEPKPVSTKNTKNNQSSSIVVATIDTPKAVVIEPTTITTSKTPTSGFEPVGAWALINLIATILTGLIALFMLLVKKQKDENEEEYSEDDRKDIRDMRIFKVVGLVIGVISALWFLFTEDMRLPMILVDKWTFIMIVFLLMEILSAIIIKHKKEQGHDNGNS